MLKHHRQNSEKNGSLRVLEAISISLGTNAEMGGR